MRNKEQSMFFSVEDLDLAKIMFKDNEERLYALRNFLFQFPLNDEEEKMIKFNDEEITLIRKFVSPSISPDAPIHQQRSLYLPLNKIREYSQEGALAHIYAQDILISYIDQMLNKLEDGSECDIVLKGLTKEMGVDQEEVRYVNMLAFLNIISFIDERIGEIKTLSNPPKEKTEEEIAKEAQMNSSK